MQSRRSFIRKNLIGTFLFSALGSIFPIASLLNNRPKKSRLNALVRDWEQTDFLMDSKRTYFNTSSLGPSLKNVVEAVCSNWNHLEVNGYDGKQLAKNAHKKVGEFFNVPSEDIAMTRNTTEGINIAAKSIPLKKGDEVIMTTHEHVGGAAAWLVLEQEIGIKVKLWDVPLSGEGLIEDLTTHISPATRVIAVSHVLCTTGMRLPIEEIAQLCREKKIYSVIDGAQAVGMIPVNLNNIKADFYACAAHKWLFGPKGVGMLYVNPNIMKELHPVFVGAYSDRSYNLNKKEFVLRQVAERNTYGTRNVSLMVGLETALAWNVQKGIDLINSNATEQIRYFKSLIPLNNFELLEPNEEFRSSILTLRSIRKDNKTLVHDLHSQYNIRTRYIYENNLDAVRISFAIFNTKQQIDQLALAITTLTK